MVENREGFALEGYEHIRFIPNERNIEMCDISTPAPEPELSQLGHSFVQGCKDKCEETGERVIWDKGNRPP